MPTPGPPRRSVPCGRPSPKSGRRSLSRSRSPLSYTCRATTPIIQQREPVWPDPVHRSTPKADWRHEPVVVRSSPHAGSLGHLRRGRLAKRAQGVSRRSLCSPEELGPRSCSSTFCDRRGAPRSARNWRTSGPRVPTGGVLLLHADPPTACKIAANDPVGPEVHAGLGLPTGTEELGNYPRCRANFCSSRLRKSRSITPPSAGITAPVCAIYTSDWRPKRQGELFPKG